MTALRRHISAINGGLAALTLGAPFGWAIDYQPFDWAPLPPGTNVVMGYYEFGLHDEYNNKVAGTFKNNTHLYNDLGVARYLYYGEDLIFGHQWDVNVLLPFGSLTDGKIDGHMLGNASGIADPVASAGFWFINRPEQRQFFSAADYITLPIGTYDEHRPLNLGANRWQNDIQADFMQGFGDKFTLDVSADWVYYGDNDEAGTGHQKLTQKSTYGAYTWLSYDVTDVLRRSLPNASNASISIGYAGLFGGEQKIAGRSNGAKTREDQLRLTYMMFLSPTWQGLVSVSHDIDASGQFKQNFGLMLRIASLF